MRLLLDTHVLIWILDRNPTLSVAAKRAVADGRNQVFVSAATAWEIVIKRALGKLKFNGDYVQALELYRFTSLSISAEHALGVAELPPLHRDPFDRLIVAQAKREGLTVVSRDRRFVEYGVDCIAA